MDSSNRPNKIVLPWANGAVAPYINTIPKASQIGILNGGASLTDGFPPLTFIPIDAGGYPPRGADANGILNIVTAGLRWLEAGGLFPYDSAFATEIGGYQIGAVLPSTFYRGLLWTSLVDGNLGDPDAGAPNWLPFNRWRLTGNTTFYVNGSTGADTNNGLAPSGTAPNGPFRTIARARFVLENFVDLSGFVASIRVSSGTYTNDPVTMAGRLPGASQGTGSVIWQAVDGPVTLITTNFVGAVLATSGAAFTLQGVWSLSSPVGVGTIVAAMTASQAEIELDGDFTYPGSRDANIHSGANGFINYATGCTEIIGTSTTCPRHWLCLYGFLNCGDVGDLEVSFSGVPNFSIAFVDCRNLGWVQADGFSVAAGTCTGTRFLAAANGLISTGSGANPNFFPGSIAGSESDGGQYV